MRNFIREPRSLFGGSNTSVCSGVPPSVPPTSPGIPGRADESAGG